MKIPAQAERLIHRLKRSLGTGEDIDAVLRGAGVVLIIQLVGSALAYTSQVLLARWMGAFEYGIFVYAWSWATILPVLGSLGLNKAVLRFVPEYFSQQDWARLSGMIRRALAMVFGANSVMALLAALLVFTFADRMADYYVIPLYIGFASVPLLGLLTLYSEMSRGFGWAGTAYTPPLLIRPGLFILGVAVLPLLAWPRSSMVVLVTAFATCFLTVVIQAVRFQIQVPKLVRAARPSYHSSYWLSISIPLFLADGILLVLWQVDILMLGAIKGPEAIAVYNACMKTAGLGLFVFNALVAMVVPRFAAMYAEGDQEKLQAFARSVARWIFWPSLVVAVGVLIVGKLILSMFGPTFVSGYAVLVVLTVAYLLTSITGPTSGYLSVSGNQKSIVMPSATAAVANIVLNALLIPRLGGMGAGIASLATMALLAVWLYVLVKRRLGIRALFF